MLPPKNKKLIGLWAVVLSFFCLSLFVDSELITETYFDFKNGKNLHSGLKLKDGYYMISKDEEAGQYQLREKLSGKIITIDFKRELDFDQLIAKGAVSRIDALGQCTLYQINFDEEELIVSSDGSNPYLISFAGEDTSGWKSLCSIFG